MVRENERGSTKLALKSGFWYVVSTFITKGLAFITTPIFARLMTPSDYGEFSNFANWQSLLIIIVSGELYNTLSRAYYDFKDKYDEYASTVAYAGGALTIIFYLLFLICGDWIYRLVAIPKEFVHLMFFTMIFQGVRQVYLTKERTLYKYKSVALISLLSLVIPTLTSIFIVFNVDENIRLSARMYGFYIPYALIGVYCAVVVIKAGRVFDKQYIKYAAILAAPLLVHYLTTYILSSTNTIITKSVLGAEAAAVVSITTSIINILTILFQAVTGAMTTFIMDNLEIRNYKKVQNCITVFAVASAVISFGIILFGPEIVRIMGGAKYASADVLIPGSVLAVFFQILTSILAIILTYDKNVVKTAIFTGVIAAISVVLKILFLAQIGYVVLPIINTMAFICTMIANYYLIKHAGYKQCIDLKKISGIIAALVVLTGASSFLYQNSVARYSIVLILFGIVCAGVFVTKKKWLPFVMKKMKR